jgi:hypothetical protein
MCQGEAVGSLRQKILWEIQMPCATTLFVNRMGSVYVLVCVLLTVLLTLFFII